MKHTVLNGKRMLTVIAVMIAVFAVMTVVVQTDGDDSDAAVIDTLVIKTNDKPYNDDVSITNAIIVEGTYSGTVKLVSDNDVVYASLSFNNASKFSIYVNSGSPYIVSLNPGTTSITATIVSGNITLGNEKTGFTGVVKYNNDSLEFFDISGAVVGISDSKLMLSGTASAASGVGMNVESIVSMTASNEYTGGENISVSGMIGNDHLNNYFEVIKNSDGSYVLRGTLAYIERDGTSAVGTLFDLIVGDMNDCTHAVVLGISGEVAESNTVIGLGGGQYLVCLDSDKSSLVVDGVMISFAGLDMGAPNQSIFSSITGLSGTIKTNGNILAGDLTINSSVTVIVNEGSSFKTNSSSDLIVLGTLNVKGNANLYDVSSFSCNQELLSGNIAVEGKLIIAYDYKGNNIEGAYYISNGQKVFTTLSNALSQSKKVCIPASYCEHDSITVQKDSELVIGGNLFVDKKVTLTNKGTVTNNGGIIISSSGVFMNNDGDLDNVGYLMAYGLFSNKGAFKSTIFADVSYYDNVTTRIASLPVILENVSSGDNLILRRNVTVMNDATLPEGVTLSTNSWKLAVDKNVIFNVNGTLNVISEMQIDGTMNVIGEVFVKDGGSLIASGKVDISGEMTVSTTTTIAKSTITGKVTVIGTANITERVQIGSAPSMLPYYNPTTITGKISLGSNALAIVYGYGFDATDNFNVSSKTVFKFDDNVYATESAANNSVDLELLTPKITGSGFAQWLDSNGKAVKDTHNVGVYSTLYADINTELYKVNLTNNLGIEWILDGVTSYGNGGEVLIPYGEHSFEIKILEGYSGTPSIVMTTSSQEHRINQNEDFLISEDCGFRVYGVYMKNADEGNQLILILITVIILAVIAIVAMLFLLARKNRHNRMEELEEKIE